jgi:Flp pilus assembly pilin Flp
MSPSISTAVARPMRLACEFLSDTRATTSIEYALLASCIAVGIVTVIGALGTTVRDDLWQKVLDALQS